MPPDIDELVARFAVDGELVDAAALAGGHINESWVATLIDGDVAARFVLQRINPHVFRDPARLMRNIQRVTTHLRTKLEAGGESATERRTLTVVPTRDGKPFRTTGEGAAWRMYRFVENTHTVERDATPDQAYSAARAFGQFQTLLADLPAPRLHETIADFHNTPLRFDALEQAIAADPHDRFRRIQRDIEHARARRASAGLLLELQRAGALPERVVHNDAKISNVLFDDETGEALCVIDLDIVMPGLSLYDFGDLVRSCACTAAEDETDLARVEVDRRLFEALARGYLDATHDMLTPAEREHLVAAGVLIALEQGVRFLTDFLEGDRYYRIDYPDQNLDRARAQFKLVASLDRNEAALRRATRR